MRRERQYTRLPYIAFLQRQALQLARDFIRAAREKPEPLRKEILSEVRSQFEANRSIDKKNVQLIEHLLRKGVAGTCVFEGKWRLSVSPLRGLCCLNLHYQTL